MSIDPPYAAHPSLSKPEPPVLNWISRIEITVAGLLFLSLFTGVIWQVLGRYFPVLNWAGAGEIARYSLVGLTFISVGYLIAKNGQITVAVIDSVVGPRGASVVRFVAAALLALICLGLAIEAWELFSNGFGRSTAVLQIPFAYLYLFPLLGFTSGLLAAIRNMLRARRPEPDLLVNNEEK